VNFWYSLFKGEKAPQNPWEDNGLEWSLPSPAPHGNWERVPTVYRGPYEFSSPEVSDRDYLPQHEKRPTDREPASTTAPSHSEKGDDAREGERRAGAARVPGGAGTAGLLDHARRVRAR